MSRRPVEWPTLAMLAGTYALWALATTWAAALWLPFGMALAMLAIAQHSSLSHEVLHGHPFRNRHLNEMLVFPCLGLFVPYGRFRDLHLAHHQDSLLTDPYDDPESNYMDPAVWSRLPRPLRAVLMFNNTLLGRMVVGPLVGQIMFMHADWRSIRAGDRGALAGWLWHVPAVIPVLIWVQYAAMPLWAYVVCAYGGLSILKIRTFLEHRAHERCSGRTVVIEDRGPLALMFLNNNYHVVHHMHPQEPWYRLPQVYARNRGHYLRRNDDYVYTNYAQIFRRYFLRAKDPVPHPHWTRD
ncbi:fatty acid desaturase [Roseovarius spongiae]|uniref:Fatty acid desaturase n=1 Tax=Roseovarius spongiae TaxID=2320272 RepID=A0A3A8B453_9RHOB|nr:fatty acid desaturase [Roseovarius spongiae]RKF16381.1 fatty acid desaturase [Roseovarius spongiae]